MSAPVTSPARAAMSRLCEFRAAEQMRGSDGWMIRQFGLEARDERPVYGFMLECWRTTLGECDCGDQVFGYVEDGEVVVEQFP